MTVISPVRCLAGAAIVASVVCGMPLAAAAQSPNETVKAAPVERLGPNVVRIGNVHVDTAKQEVSVKGVVNDVEILEFIANPKGGAKAYESAIELDTDAVNFNLGLILIGLDHTRTKWPRRGDPPMLPNGDPVEIWVEWTEAEKPRRVRAEQLVYSEVTKTTLSEGPWVYTGSVFIPENNAFLADLNGALIGFVHRGAPVIDSPRPLPQGPYEANRLNPALNLKAGTSVTLIVKALPRDKPH
jgi:hypothetical protein